VAAWTVCCGCLELLVAPSLRRLVAVWAGHLEDLPSKFRMAARSSFLRHGCVDLQLALQRGRWCRGRATWSHPVHDAGSKKSTRWASRIKPPEPQHNFGLDCARNPYTHDAQCLGFEHQWPSHAGGAEALREFLLRRRRWGRAGGPVRGDVRRLEGGGGGEDSGARNEELRESYFASPGFGR
jgi:hypothetical protein